MQLRYLLHTTMLCGLAFSPVIALANPSGGNVVGGSASIRSSGNTLTVQQTSNRAIINWSSFDIGSGETTQFQQPNSSAIALNRISENSPSQINGTLTANGNIILVNPNGVLFGAGAQVNVNSLVATSADTDNTAFLNGGAPSFNKPGNPKAQIINQGTITVGQAGLVGLVAPHVENQGVITATLGKAQLASGDGFVLDMAGDGITQVTVSNSVAQQLAANSGLINAPGGQITLSAAAAESIISALVVNTGELRADTCQRQGGTIILSATKGTVTSSGAINSRGNNPGDSGGNASISAQNVQQNGTINVSGQQNGGNVNINFTGSYTDTPSSSITASGVSGNGGSINVSGANPSTTLTASGTYQATSQPGQGGSVAVAAGTVNLQGAKLDASGASGGLVTAGFTPSTGMTTQNVAIDSATTLHADGSQGAGGAIVLDGETMTVEGILSAIGMMQGGTINVNSDQSYADTIDASLTVVSTKGVGGGVYVEGGADASITASGTYVADGGTTGGSIDFLAGQDIFLLGAFLSSEGKFGGGIIRIGGDFEGAEGTERSKYTTIGKNTRIYASATGNGDGGTVAVWSDADTQFYGTIYAEGGPNGGNGGYVETSGHMLTVNGSVNASAPNGVAGTWLMDPNNLIINTSATSNAGSSPNWTAGSGTGNVLNTDIDAALNAGTSVTLTASGSIEFAASISKTAGGDATLTASAGTDINVDSGATISSTVGKLNVVFDADTAAGGGAISIAANITSNGGNITLGGGSSGITAGTLNADGTINTAATGYAVGDAASQYGVYINGVTVDAGGGNIIINGQGYSSTSMDNLGVYNTFTIKTSGAGTINVSGIGGGTGAASGQNIGIISALTSTVNGNITLIGTGGTGDQGMNDGIQAGVETSGSGSILMNGTGGSGAAGFDVGVDILYPVKATGSGGIILIGTGNGAGDTSGGTDYGVYVEGLVSASGGNISITGTGGATNQGVNIGVNLSLSNVSNTGSGGITIKGTGGGTGASSSNLGVYSFDGDIWTSNGAIVIQGTGGDSGGSGSSNEGVGFMGSTYYTKTTGSGSITITGIGGPGSSSYGIDVESANNVETTGTGNITLNADSIVLNAANAVNSKGNINFNSYTTGDTIGVGTNATGTVNLSDTDLGDFTWGSGKTFTIGNTTEGNIDINTAITFLNNGNVTLISNGTIYLDKSGDTSPTALSKTAGSTTSLTMQAGTDITLNNAISTTSGHALNVTLDSDYAGAGGAISIGGNITSNGGNITMGGGSGTIIAGNGYAVGNAVQAAGVTTTSTINAGGGNIIVNGQGYTGGTNTSNAFGAYFNGGELQTSGTGTISINGIGGGSGSGTDNAGVNIGMTTVNTVNGNLSITGTGGSGVIHRDGIDNNGTIESTGSGSITMTGTGGSGFPGYGFGIEIDGEIEATASGNVTMTGSGSNTDGIRNEFEVTVGSGAMTVTGSTTASTNSGILAFGGAFSSNCSSACGAISLTGTNTAAGNGLAFEDYSGIISNAAAITLTGVAPSGTGIYTDGNGNTIGGGGEHGNITLIADTLAVTSGDTIQTTGTVTFEPYTASTSVGFSGGAGTLQVTEGIMNLVHAPIVTVGSLTDTGALTTGAFTWESTLNILNLESGGTAGSITIGGNVTQSSTANASLNVNSGSDITSNSAITASGTDKLNILLDSDYAAAGGAITIGGNITSNGGNITLGGGNGTITAGSGYAVGDAAQAAGVTTTSTINAGGGNIIVNGQGYTGGTNTSDAFGAYFNGGALQTSGTGTITINGIGGGSGSGDSNYGVFIGFGTISTANGNLTLTGTGGNSTSDHDDGIDALGTIESTGSGNITMSGTAGGTGGGWGIGILNELDVEATGSGNVTMTGTSSMSEGIRNYYIVSVGSGAMAITGNTTSAGDVGVLAFSGGQFISGCVSSCGAMNITGTGTSGYGVDLESSNIVKSNGAAITLTGVAPSGTGIYTDGNDNYIGGASEHGNITLVADTLAVTTGDTIRTTGTVTFEPYTASTTIGVNGSAGTLQVTSRVLSSVLAGTTVIGNSSDSGLMRVAGANLSGDTLGNLSLLNGNANIQFDGGGTALKLASGDNFSETATGGAFITSATGTITTQGAGSQTYNNAVTLGGDLTLTTGTGAVTFGSTVNGDFNLNATAGTISFGGSLGGSTPLAAVSLTSTNSMSLPSVTASSIFAQTIGASADIALPSGTVLTASGAGTAISLASGQNFINDDGSTALSASNGRWLVYSTNPADNTLGGLTAAFDRYSCTYGGSCPSFPATGNGLLYSYTPLLTVTPSGIAITYGSAAPNLSGYAYMLSGYLGSDAGSDSVTGSLTGSTTYMQGSHVGSYNINFSSGSLTSALGYGFSYANNATAITVNPAALTITADDQTKTFGNTLTFAGTEFTSSGLVNGETIGSATMASAGASASAATGSYTISISNATGGTFLASNYTITYRSGTLTISPSASVPSSVTSTPAPAPAPVPAPAPAPAPSPAPAPAPAPSPSPSPAPAPASSPSPAPSPSANPAPAPAPASSPAPAPAPTPTPFSQVPTMPPAQDPYNDSHLRAGTITFSSGDDSKPAANPDNLPASGAPAPIDPPIAAPAKFKYLDQQLDRLDNDTPDDATAQSVNDVTRSINTMTKDTRKVIKRIVVPGVASVSAASVGYVLLFGRTMYNALAMLLGLGLGGQKLDPANLLEYWEREGRNRKPTDPEKKLDSMFG